MVVERMEESGVEGNEFMYNTYMDLVSKSAATGYHLPGRSISQCGCF